MHLIQSRFYASLTDNGDTLSIDVMGPIGDGEWGAGAITAKSVKRALDSAPTAKQVILTINSDGGLATESLAIANLLRESDKYVTVKIIGIAASAASVIAAAGDETVMSVGSLQYLHRAWCACVGNADQQRDIADTLDTLTAALADIYCAKCQLSTQKMLNLLHGSNGDGVWLSAADCLAYGLADRLIADGDDDETEPDEQDDVTEETAQALASIKHSPMLRFYGSLPPALRTH